jgi:hypothetical protein
MISLRTDLTGTGPILHHVVHWLVTCKTYKRWNNRRTSRIVLGMYTPHCPHNENCHMSVLQLIWWPSKKRPYHYQEFLKMNFCQNQFIFKILRLAGSGCTLTIDKLFKTIASVDVCATKAISTTKETSPCPIISYGSFGLGFRCVL